MNEDEIFVLDADGSLTPLRAERYESEHLLQMLLAQYPDLLAGAQMDPVTPRRWLLIAQELGVPGACGGSDRWSLDHLFVDQDGIPTLVEVKRSTDTRIRREVVGQMFDYAANGVLYWPLERIRSEFDRTAGGGPGRADEVVQSFVGEGTADDFWQLVGNNLSSGRMRLVFVADVVPPELRRIVEFLNEQMHQVDVLAVEVRQYVGGALRTLVPRVIGPTAAAERAKARPIERSYEEWLAASSSDTRELERRLLDWATEHDLDTARTPGSLQVLARPRRPLATFYPRWGHMDVALEPLREAGKPAEADRALTEIAAIVEKAPTSKYPSIPSPIAVTHWDVVQEKVLGPTLSAYRLAME